MLNRVTRRRAAHKIAGIAAAVAALIPGIATAPAMASDLGYAELRSDHWGGCLEVQGARLDELADVTVGSCVPGRGAHQQWRLRDLGNGFFEVRVRHTDMCLDVFAASPDDGGRLVQYPCYGGAHQQWSLRTSSWGHYKLVARHSGKCLDKGAWRVVQWNCWDAPWQSWARV